MAKRQHRPKLISLSTCGCAHCKGRAAVCMDGFEWVDKRDPHHAHRHAKEDLLGYFDRLPVPVKAALNRSAVNVCSWRAELWVEQYGAAKAVKLIRDVRFIDDIRAVTPVDGWPARRRTS